LFIIPIICLFLLLAPFIVSTKLNDLISSLSFLYKTSSPAPKAAAPIASEGKIPTDNPKYGIAKNVPPQNSRNN